MLVQVSHVLVSVSPTYKRAIQAAVKAVEPVSIRNVGPAKCTQKLATGSKVDSANIFLSAEPLDSMKVGFVITRLYCIY